MKYIAGVDIGNSTTEVCVGEAAENGALIFRASSSCPTTGTKGTLENVHGIKTALSRAMEKIGEGISSLRCIRLNEAAPVIGDTAMETLTETIITDSSMIGHNPSTPAGAGQATGEILLYDNLVRAVKDTPYIIAVSRKHPYEEIAAQINLLAQQLKITGLKMCIRDSHNTLHAAY